MRNPKLTFTNLVWLLFMFHYQWAIAQNGPTVTDFFPKEVCKSDSLTIQGSNMDRVRIIQFGNIQLMSDTWETNINFSQINIFDLTSPSLPSGMHRVILVGMDFRDTIGTITLVQPELVSIRTPDNAGEFCVGEEIQLSSSIEGQDYNWSNGETNRSTIVNIEKDTTFSLTITDRNGCTAIARRNINALPLPDLTIQTSDNRVCSGEEVTLSAIGVASVRWSSNKTTLTIIEQPSTTTTYTAFGVGNNGCPNEESVEIQVDLLPTVSISGNETICEGESTMLEASGAEIYQWSTNELGNKITVMPSQSTVYSITATDINGCQSIRETRVDVNPVPDFSIMGPGSTNCADEVVTLSVPINPDWTYLWSANAMNSPLSQVNVSPSTRETYSVTITDKNTGCFSVGEKTVSAGRSLNIILEGPSEICPGDTAFFSVNNNPDFTYSWNNGATTAETFYLTEMIRSVSVTVTDETNGCSGTALSILSPSPVPIITIDGPDDICLGEEATLTASGGVGYLWSTGAVDDNITVSPSGTTTYFVEAIGSNGCRGSASKELIVESSPLVNLPSKLVEVCSGEDFEIDLAPNNANGNAYSWTATGDDFLSGFSNGNGSVISSSIQNTRGVVGNVFYVVSATQAKCSTVPDTLSVRVNPKPTIELDGELSLCSGETTNIFLNTNTASSTLRWSTGGLGGSLDGSGPNGSIIEDQLVNPTDFILQVRYGIIAITDAGCRSDSITITPWVYPIPDLMPSTTEQTIQSGTQFNVSFLAEGNISVLGRWRPTMIKGGVIGTTSGTGEMFSNLLELEQNQTLGEVIYEVEPVLITRNNRVCVGENVQEVRAIVLPRSFNQNIFVPTLFTPNGDGENDLWGIEFESLENIELYTITVLSRNGAVVLPETDLFQASQWDAANVPGGAYIYILKGPNSTFKGALTIFK